MSLAIGMIGCMVVGGVVALLLMAMRLAHEERMRKAYTDAVLTEYRAQLQKDREWFEGYKEEVKTDDQ